MNNEETNSAGSAWKGHIIKLLIYVVVGFLAAYLYRQLKK
jgi:hypothetical protein